MMRSKRCPKCIGNLVLDCDFLGWYEQCIQCGHMHYVEMTVKIPNRQQPKREEMSCSTR